MQTRITLLLVLAMLAGCIEDPLEPTSFLREGHWGFEADYETNHGAIHLIYNRVASIADSHLEHRSAYYLEIQWTHDFPEDIQEPGPWRDTLVNRFYLDSDYRQVRFEDPCGFKPDDICDRSWVDWGNHGHLAPFGLGMLETLIDGREEHIAYFEEAQINATVTTTTDDIKIQVHEDSGVEQRAWMDLRGTWRFTEYPVPAQAFFPAGPNYFGKSFDFYANLTTFEYTKKLEQIDDWPSPPNPGASAPRPALYPGADEPMFGLDASSQDALEFLKQNSSTARQALQHGCVTSTAILPRSAYWEDDVTGQHIVNPEYHTFEFGVVDGEGQYMNYKVHRVERFTGNTWEVKRDYEKEENEVRRHSNLSQACTIRADGLPPIVDAHAFKDEFTSLETGLGEPWHFISEVSLGRTVVDKSGTTRYVIVFEGTPLDSGGGVQTSRPYNVAFDASRKIYTMLDVAPEHMRALDGQDS